FLVVVLRQTTGDLVDLAVGREQPRGVAFPLHRRQRARGALAADLRLVVEVAGERYHLACQRFCRREEGNGCSGNSRRADRGSCERPHRGLHVASFSFFPRAPSACRTSPAFASARRCPSRPSGSTTACTPVCAAPGQPACTRRRG